MGGGGGGGEINIAVGWLRWIYGLLLLQACS